MGEVHSLFGLYPEPTSEPLEVTHRQVNDQKLDDLIRRFTEANQPLLIAPEDIAFLLTQLGQSRSALKDIETGLTQVQRDDIGGSLYGVFASTTLTFIANVLAFDETQIGMDPDNMSPEISHDLLALPLCPGCGLADPQNTTMPAPMVAKHPFFRIDVARCIKKHGARP